MSFKCNVDFGLILDSATDREGFEAHAMVDAIRARVLEAGHACEGGWDHDVEINFVISSPIRGIVATPTPFAQLCAAAIQAAWNHNQAARNGRMEVSTNLEDLEDTVVCISITRDDLQDWRRVETLTVGLLAGLNACGAIHRA